MTTVYGVARQVYWQSEFERVSDRAALYNSSLVSALERYQHLPFVLARDTVVVKGLEAGSTRVLNLRLETFAKQAQVDALYVMNTEGLTIAASNWRKTPTYVGKNYGFRPYFHTALKGNRGEFFAIGVTTNLPGYFVSEAVRDIEGQVIGVVAMKVDLSPLTDSWSEGGEKLFASNEDGVVVLSSNTSWNYQTLEPLSAGTRAHIEEERQFANKPLSPLDVAFLDHDEMRLGKVNYLHHVSEIPDMKWKLHYLADKDVILQRSQRALLIASIIMSLFLAAYLILRSERIKRALRASEEDSRSLRILNEELEREIEDRRRAEKRLARTQKELKQASKLAALGELSASVSHELGQPLSAMQNYLAVADLPGSNMDNESRDVMQRLNRLVARMGQITKQLKFFARPGGDVFEDVDLRDVISGVREIMAGDIHLAQVEMLIDQPNTPLIVRGDRLRLEQVLINLLRNSLDAMKENNEHSLEIKLLSDTGKVYVNVLDRGPGLPEELADQLFESFVTTKASGEGMGLGLAISASIVEDHSGELKARTRKTGGAEFSMIIPAIMTGENLDG
ncbi:sensor histidine kinase [Kiloniella sp.]|uniref:sensor histidine kinase n=1 Tax=Kiloniella sp. TaxID=1938587 RepID=UPI003B014977